VDFFFGCFRGVGVGVGTKIFLSLVPIDSSAALDAAKFVSAARHARAAITVRAGRMQSDSNTSARFLLHMRALVATVRPSPDRRADRYAPTERGDYISEGCDSRC